MQKNDKGIIEMLVLQSKTWNPFYFVQKLDY